jgi:type III pantothenate kinase
MLLTIDIGNTNITLGLYQGDELGFRWRLATDHDRMSDEYGLQILGLLQHAGCSVAELEGVCLASVVPKLTSCMIRSCQGYLNLSPLLVTASLEMGINILYEEPEAVGADRLADAVAVQYMYGGPACVVDFGTATTFDAINSNGDYLGGAIAPGIHVAAEALFQRTAKLPRVELVNPGNVIGVNTIKAIQAGMLYGYVAMVEGMVSRFRKELGAQMKVIATGGLTDLVSSETDCIDIRDPWLTLNGLNIIWNMMKTKEDDYGESNQ